MLCLSISFNGKLKYQMLTTSGDKFLILYPRATVSSSSMVLTPTSITHGCFFLHAPSSPIQHAHRSPPSLRQCTTLKLSIRDPLPSTSSLAHLSYPACVSSPHPPPTHPHEGSASSLAHPRRQSMSSPASGATCGERQWGMLQSTPWAVAAAEP